MARRHGVTPNQLFTWGRLVAQAGLTVTGSGVPASDYRVLQIQVCKLHWLLGRKTVETEIGSARARLGIKKVGCAFRRRCRRTILDMIG
jgi:transposase-like protein